MKDIKAGVIQRISLIVLVSAVFMLTSFTGCVEGESETKAPDNAYQSSQEKTPVPPGREKDPVFEKIQQYRDLLKKNRDAGKDVSRAVELNERAKHAGQAGDVFYAEKLLDQAIASLGGTEMPAGVRFESSAAAFKPPQKPAASKSVRLKVDAGKMVVTQAVPGKDSGKGIDDYAAAFDTRLVTAKGGVISLTVGSSPVYIEPAGSAGKLEEPARDSLFGVHPAHTYGIQMDRKKLVPPSKAGYDYKAAEEIGVRWNRPEYYALWDKIQPGDDDLETGRYDWKQSDYVYNSAPEGIEIFANICVGRKRMKRGTPPNPRTHTFESSFYEKKYQEFVRALVERYDGDGVDDMAGLKKPVKFWQVDNEPDLATTDWEGYANLMKITYRAVKASCPDCRVAMGGLAMGKPGFENFYSPVLEKLGGRYVDIFDFHFFGAAGDWQILKKLSGLVRSGLDQRGYAGTEIWLTETGTWTGKPRGMHPGGGQGMAIPEQSEKDQAEELVKRYVCAASLGVKKVFWAFGMVEGFQGSDGKFDHMGLMYSGSRNGVKKLAYYTYRKMTEKLAGADLGSVKILDIGEGVAAFRFDRQGLPLYVLWGY